MKTRKDELPTEPRDLALCRCMVYELLGLGFQRPGNGLLDRLGDSAMRRAFLDAVVWVERCSDGGGTGTEEVTTATRRVFDRFDGCGGREGLRRLEETHDRIFGHAVRSAAPPYETEYGEKGIFQQPHELADLAGFYRAFGLQVRGDVGERVDHVSCQCEFMAFLARKEAHALESGDGEMLEQTRRAERVFLTDHLARFEPAFVFLLGNVDGDGFFGALGDLLSSFLRLECGRLGVRPGPRTIKLRDWQEGGLLAACGTEKGTENGGENGGEDVPRPRQVGPISISRDRIDGEF